MLAEKVNITTLEPKDTLEYTHLDCLTTTEEVRKAVKEMLGSTDGVKITLTKPNSRIVIVQLNQQHVPWILRE